MAGGLSLFKAFLQLLIDFETQLRCFSEVFFCQGVFFQHIVADRSSIMCGCVCLIGIDGVYILLGRFFVAQ